MSYITGNRAETQALADAMNASHPDAPYRAEIHTFPTAYRGPWGEAAKDACAAHTGWGVYDGTQGFTWEARAVARRLAEHPIVVISRGANS